MRLLLLLLLLLRLRAATPVVGGDRVDEVEQLEREHDRHAEPQTQRAAHARQQTVDGHFRFVGHDVRIRLVENDVQLDEVARDGVELAKFADDLRLYINNYYSHNRIELSAFIYSIGENMDIGIGLP